MLISIVLSFFHLFSGFYFSWNFYVCLLTYFIQALLYSDVEAVTGMIEKYNGIVLNLSAAEVSK
jgi:hypothetical protein